VEVGGQAVQAQNVLLVGPRDKGRQQPHVRGAVQTQVRRSVAASDDVAGGVGLFAVPFLAEPLVSDTVCGIGLPAGAGLVVGGQGVRVEEPGRARRVQHVACDGPGEAVVVPDERDEGGRLGEGVHREGVAAAVRQTADEAVTVDSAPPLTDGAPGPARRRAAVEAPRQDLSDVAVAAVLRVHPGCRKGAPRQEDFVIRIGLAAVEELQACPGGLQVLRIAPPLMGGQEHPGHAGGGLGLAALTVVHGPHRPEIERRMAEVRCAVAGSTQGLDGFRPTVCDAAARRQQTWLVRVAVCQAVEEDRRPDVVPERPARVAANPVQDQAQVRVFVLPAHTDPVVRAGRLVDADEARAQDGGNRVDGLVPVTAARQAHVTRQAEAGTVKVRYVRVEPDQR